MYLARMHSKSMLNCCAKRMLMLIAQTQQLGSSSAYREDPTGVRTGPWPTKQSVTRVQAFGLEK